MLNTRIILEGSKQERIIKMLELAGWCPGRSVDITEVESYYETCGIELSESARCFFRQYYGLAENWWVDQEYKPNVSNDFFFSPEPNNDYLRVKDHMFDDADYKLPSTDFLSVESIAGEPFVYVGSIGYNYPAEVWIGESGKIYTTHEYDNIAHAFDSIVELIDWELSKHKIDFVMIRK